MPALSPYTSSRLVSSPMIAFVAGVESAGRRGHNGLDHGPFFALCETSQAEAAAVISTLAERKRACRSQSKSGSNTPTVVAPNRPPERGARRFALVRKRYGDDGVIAHCPTHQEVKGAKFTASRHERRCAHANRRLLKRWTEHVENRFKGAASHYAGKATTTSMPAERASAAGALKRTFALMRARRMRKTPLTVLWGRADRFHSGRICHSATPLPSSSAHQ